MNRNALIQASTPRMGPAETLQLYRLNVVVIEYILHGWLKSPFNIPLKAYDRDGLEIYYRSIYSVILASTRLFEVSNHD